MKVVLVYLKPFRHNSLLKCVLQAKIAKKITKNPYFGSSMSLILMSIERAYKTSY